MANSRLENYVETVAANLKSLPKAEREQQIAELRQHLESLISAEEAQGVSEEFATEAAIKQFGSAREVGTDLGRSAWRMRLKQLPEPVVTALSVTAGLAIITLLFRYGYAPLVRAIVPTLPQPSGVPAHAVVVTNLASLTPSFFLGMAAMALLFLRDGASRTAQRLLNTQTVAGAAFLWGVLTHLCQSLLMLGGNHALFANHLWDLESLQAITPLCFIVPPALTAWIVTRISPRFGISGIAWSLTVSTLIGIADFAIRSGPNLAMFGPVLSGYGLTFVAAGISAFVFGGIASILNRRHHAKAS